MSEGNSRILKNTIYLYIRQAITLVLGLLTTRIVLDKLGVSNYGVYTLIGSFVSMFTILNSVLQSSTRRFLALALGEQNKNKAKETFQTSVSLHIWIAIVVCLVLETVGLYFLNHGLNIEQSAMLAANWVFQCSVLGVALNIIATPYIASVTSNEKFDMYAWMSIIDVVSKLLILFLLVIIPFNKLIVYGILMLATTFIVDFTYFIYCNKKFNECTTTRLRISKPLMKDMLKFSGWDTFGTTMSVLNVQGINILLNLFFGTIVNAARGVANTVIFTTQQFVGGFIVAAEPQLVKSYATKDYANMQALIFNVSQMTLFMLAIFAVPIWLEIDFVLQLWLGKDVPEYCSSFIKVSILICFITQTNLMVVKGIVATGKVKTLNLCLAPIELIILPIMYLAMKLGMNPVQVYWISGIPSLIKFTINNIILSRIINFQGWKYLTHVFLKNLAIVAISLILPAILSHYMIPGWLRFISVGSSSVIITIALMWGFALNAETRRTISAKAMSLLHIHPHN